MKTNNIHNYLQTDYYNMLCHHFACFRSKNKEVFIVFDTIYLFPQLDLETIILKNNYE